MEEDIQTPEWSRISPSGQDKAAKGNMEESAVSARSHHLLLRTRAIGARPWDRTRKDAWTAGAFTVCVVKDLGAGEGLEEESLLTPRRQLNRRLNLTPIGTAKAS